MKKNSIATLLVVVCLASLGHAQTGPAAPRLSPQDRRDGFIPFYWDAARARVLLEIPKLDEELLYFVSVAKGIGSVELGVDRGLTSSAMAIWFERAGPRVQVMQKNLQFRALNQDRALLGGIEESFAGSTIASLPIETDDGGRLVVDATPLVIRDAIDLEGLLRRRGQGSFRLDAGRSGIFLARTKAFPRNTEIEATLTFASDNPGSIVSRVAPDGRSLTIRLHHSLVEPPDPGYRPRAADPRIGISTVGFKDYSAPHSTDPEVRWIRRWRLEKRDPSAAMSEPRTPIVFYLDPGIPEPIRSAMRDGTLWWNQAFEAAGFRNAVQVKDPPPDLDPMDIRYSYILWVNRDERGFSNGGHFADPRTGEILVAKPRMDSHRIRTISNYWQSYRPSTSDGAPVPDAPETDDMNADCAMFVASHDWLLRTPAAQSGRAPAAMGRSEQALVAARQALVTAHEVGHTLGFGHNWTSSINDRASVMEYPSPRIVVTPGSTIDLSQAFQSAIGEYDTFMVRYSYTEFRAAAERAGLDQVLREMRARGILYTASTDPRWNRYDDLSNPATYLRETLRQRRLLLDRYGPEILAPGEPLGELRDMRLWMTYLHHRWAIDAGVRYIGGMYHNIVVKPEGAANEATLPATEIVPAALQREILQLLMEAIHPDSLALPERLLVNLAPRPDRRDPEEFHSGAGYAFDHLGAARTLAAMVLEQLLEPERAARLVLFADRQPGALTLTDVIAAALDAGWRTGVDSSPMHRSLRRVVQRVAIDAAMILGADGRATPEVRAVALDRVARLARELSNRHDPDATTEAHIRQAERDIARYLENPAAFAPKTSALPQPPGAPLGAR